MREETMTTTRIRLALVGIVVLMRVSSGLAAAPTSATNQPWMDRSLAPEQRAAMLVKAMTVEEKILEIHMLDQREHPREVAAIERLGIPAFRITNGPAGAGPGDARPTQPATALPAAIGLSASWDLELAKKFGQLA